MTKRLPITVTGVMIMMAFLASCKKQPESQNVPPGLTGDYSVFAWNDLGMHCLNPTYDKLVR